MSQSVTGSSWAFKPFFMMFAWLSSDVARHRGRLRYPIPQQLTTHKHTKMKLPYTFFTRHRGRLRYPIPQQLTTRMHTQMKLPHIFLTRGLSYHRSWRNLYKILWAYKENPLSQTSRFRKNYYKSFPGLGKTNVFVPRKIIREWIQRIFPVKKVTDMDFTV